MKIAVFADNSVTASLKAIGHDAKERMWDECDGVVIDTNMSGSRTYDRFMTWVKDNGKEILNLDNICHERPVYHEGPIKHIEHYDVVAVNTDWSIAGGGGAFSMFALMRELRMSGYDAATLTYGEIADNNVRSKVYLFTNVTARPKEIDKIRSRDKDAKFVLHVDKNQESEVPVTWDGWSAFTCNSEYTLEGALSSGLTNVFVQKPILNPVYSKVRGRRKGKNILQLSLLEGRGRDTFFEVAKLLPDMSFIGTNWEKHDKLDCEVPENVTLAPWTMQTWRRFKDSAVLLLPNTSSVKETYGRAVAEAIANGVPVVCSDGGYLKWWKALYPKHVTLVKEDSKPEVYARAVKKALKMKPGRANELWDPDIKAWEQLLGVLNVTKKEDKHYVINVSAGIGDAISALPALRVMAKDSTLYVDTNDKYNSKETLLASGLFSDKTPPPHYATRRLAGPVVPDDTMRTWQTETRLEMYARRMFVHCNTSKYEFPVSETTKAIVDGLLPDNGKKNVGVVLCSQARYPMKTMQMEAQLGIINELANRGDVNVILVGAGESVVYPEVDGIDNVYDIRGKTSITDALILCGRLDAFVGVDTGLTHSACIQHVPSVIIYGPTGFEGRHIDYSAYGGVVENIIKGMDCQPCWKGAHYGCSEPAECLNVDPVKVSKALGRIMK